MKIREQWEMGHSSHRALVVLRTEGAGGLSVEPRSGLRKKVFHDPSSSGAKKRWWTPSRMSVKKKASEATLRCGLRGEWLDAGCIPKAPREGS